MANEKKKFETSVTDAPAEKVADVTEAPSAPVETEAPKSATPATPATPPSKRLAAEQEAGRAALQRKHSPHAKDRELKKGAEKNA